MRWALLVFALILGAFFAFGRSDDAWGRADRRPQGELATIRSPRFDPEPIALVEEPTPVSFAVPKGQGRVEVHVGALAGVSKAGVRVRLLDGGWALAGRADTDSAGRCQFDAPPGSYELKVGTATKAVAIEAGITSRVEFRPEQFGAVQVTGAPNIMTLRLIEYGAWDAEEVEAVPSGLFPYMESAFYLLWGSIEDNGEDIRPLDFFFVGAGRLVEIEVELPPGALEVVVFAPGTFESAGTLSIELRALRGDRWPEWPVHVNARAAPTASKQGGTIWKKRIIALGHGTYDLKVSHRRLQTLDQLVTIGTRTETIELELAPK